jgi:hypothetical protein
VKTILSIGLFVIRVCVPSGSLRAREAFPLAHKQLFPVDLRRWWGLTVLRRSRGQNGMQNGLILCPERKMFRPDPFECKKSNQY